MIESQIEMMLASPPERDELVVHLFAKDGGQLAEIYRDQGTYWIDVCLSDYGPLTFKLDAMIYALTRSQMKLHERLGDIGDS